jgi:hypothetical protein
MNVSSVVYTVLTTYNALFKFVSDFRQYIYYN